LRFRETKQVQGFTLALAAMGECIARVKSARGGRRSEHQTTQLSIKKLLV
jgi:hypothetical protein